MPLTSHARKLLDEDKKHVLIVGDNAYLLYDTLRIKYNVDNKLELTFINGTYEVCVDKFSMIDGSVLEIKMVGKLAVIVD